MTTLSITVDRDGEREDLALKVDTALLAGFTGRDQEAARAHVEELAAHGIHAPHRIPTIYAVPGSRVTTADRILVDGTETSGEAEFVLVRHGDRVLVTVGSDHTDRELERYSIVKSKQGTDKPVAPTWWDLADVEEHWDSLRLTAQVRTGDGWTTYQQGDLATMMTPADLLEEVESSYGADVDREAVFSGTLAIIEGEFIAGDVFRAVLDDPVLKRRLVCEYSVEVLPRFD